jgi:carbon storage regulator CsrA
MGLIITRIPKEIKPQKSEVHIGDSITITVLKVDGNSVSLDIKAPKPVNIVRGELLDNRGNFYEPVDYQDYLGRGD